MPEEFSPVHRRDAEQSPGSSLAVNQSCEGFVPKAKVFVVDDQAVVRKGLRRLLNLQPDMELCGEAESLSMAKSAIPALQPDLVVVDLDLDDGDGFELMQYLLPKCPTLKLLVFSSYEDLVLTERAFKCGAQGYVVKQDGPRELIHAVRLLLKNQKYVSTTISTRQREFSPTGRKARTAE